MLASFVPIAPTSRVTRQQRQNPKLNNRLMNEKRTITQREMDLDYRISKNNTRQINDRTRAVDEKRITYDDKPLGPALPSLRSRFTRPISVDQAGDTRRHLFKRQIAPTSRATNQQRRDPRINNRQVDGSRVSTRQARDTEWFRETSRERQTGDRSRTLHGIRIAHTYNDIPAGPSPPTLRSRFTRPMNAEDAGSARKQLFNDASTSKTPQEIESELLHRVRLNKQRVVEELRKKFADDDAKRADIARLYIQRRMAKKRSHDRDDRNNAKKRKINPGDEDPSEDSMSPSRNENNGSSPGVQGRIGNARHGVRYGTRPTRMSRSNRLSQQPTNHDNHKRSKKHQKKR
jgi:hypothetical protein